MRSDTGERTVRRVRVPTLRVPRREAGGCRGCRAAPGLLFLALTALAAQPSRAQSSVGVPLVVPRASVTLLLQLNRATRFEVLRFSEVVAGEKGTVVQTAVVNVIQGGGFIVPPRLTLFLPAGDVGLVQRLNQGLPIQPLVFVRMVITNPLTFVPAALVLITPTPDTVPKLGPGDCLLVLPGGSFVLVSQLNGGGNFSLIRVSQVSGGGSGGVQTVLIVVRQTGGRDANQGFSLIVPEADLPALIKLNTGLQFQVVRVFTGTFGGATMRLAEVQVTCTP
jgi:hypothetical protein